MATGVRASRREDVLSLIEQSDEPLTIAALADELGMHPNTVRFHLERLVADGRIEMTKDARGQRGRPAQLFRMPRLQSGADARRYRMLAEILVDALADRPDPVGAAVEAGRRWGRREAESTDADDPITGLVDILDRIGFSPRAVEGSQAREDQHALDALRALDERRTLDAPHALDERHAIEGSRTLDAPRAVDGPPALDGPRVDVCHCPFLELAQQRPEVVCSVHLGIMQGALGAWDSDVTVRRLVRHERPDACVAHLSVGSGEAAGGDRRLPQAP